MFKLFIVANIYCLQRSKHPANLFGSFSSVGICLQPCFMGLERSITDTSMPGHECIAVTEELSQGLTTVTTVYICGLSSSPWSAAVPDSGASGSGYTALLFSTVPSIPYQTCCMPLLLTLSHGRRVSRPCLQ